jgi:hypothetical protein
MMAVAIVECAEMRATFRRSASYRDGRLEEILVRESKFAAVAPPTTLFHCGHYSNMQSANGTVQSRKSVAVKILTYSFRQRAVFNLLAVFISKWNVT